MSDEKEIDLGITDAQPTMAETLYAQRIAAGLAPMPEDGDPSFTKGTKQALTVLQDQGSQVVLAAENAQAVALAGRIGYEGELTIGGVEERIRLYQRRTCEDVLELGKALLVLKELCRHGEFQQRVELLMNYNLAAKFMQAARKFSKSVNLTDLVSKVGTQTKLLELLVLDDDEAAALAGGEEVRGIALDEIDCLTPSELRARLRQLESGETEKASRLARQLNETEKKCEVFERQLNRTQIPGDGEFDARTYEVRQEAAALEYGARIHIDDLETLFEQLLNEDAAPQVQVLRLRCVGIAVGALYSRAQALFELLREGMDGDMPVKPHGDLFLSESEKDTLEAGLTIIRENHKRRKGERADEAMRQAAAHQKGPGRRIGSKNKKGGEA